jgi:hypothetical protein
MERPQVTGGTRNGARRTATRQPFAPPVNTQEDTMASSSKSTVRIRMSLPVGLNDKGKETRAYIQQIIGPNAHKLPTVSPGGRVNVYDWIIRNAGKPEETVKAPDGTMVKLPASNFEKLGRGDADSKGLYRVKFSVGDGIYRLVRVDIDKRDEDTGKFPGYPETVFCKVSGGQVTKLDQNEARAAVGLPPIAEGKSRAARVEDEDSDISL